MAIAYNTSIVRSGLVLHLDAANRKSYPGSGTTWTDLSGLGNSGTLTNGPTYSSDNKGGIVFDGSNDYVLLPNEPICDSINGKSELTASIWFRRNGGTGTQRNLFSIGVNVDSPTLNKFGILFTSSNNIRINTRSIAAETGQLKDTVDTFTTNNWTLVTATVNLQINDVKIYINGTEVSATGTISFAQTTFSNEIGVRNTIGANPGLVQFFVGSISDTCFYNRVLTPTEIKQNFEALRGRYGI